MIRVEAILRESLKRVTTNKREGKTENSKDDSIKTATINMINEKVMLKEIRTSSKRVGIGITITPKITMIPAATNNSWGL